MHLFSTWFLYCMFVLDRTEATLQRKYKNLCIYGSTNENTEHSYTWWSWYVFHDPWHVSHVSLLQHIWFKWMGKWITDDNCHINYTLFFLCFCYSKRAKSLKNNIISSNNSSRQERFEVEHCDHEQLVRIQRSFEMTQQSTSHCIWCDLCVRKQDNRSDEKFYYFNYAQRTQKCLLLISS